MRFSSEWASPGDLIDRLCMVNIYLQHELETICKGHPVDDIEAIEVAVIRHAHYSLDRGNLIRQINRCLAAAPPPAEP